MNPQIELVERLRREQLEMEPRIPLARAFRITARIMKLTSNEIAGDSRLTETVRRRWVFWWVLRQVSDGSYPEIARMSGRNHSTLVNGLARLRKLMEADANVRSQADEIVRLVRVECATAERTA